MVLSVGTLDEEQSESETRSTRGPFGPRWFISGRKGVVPGGDCILGVRRYLETRRIRAGHWELGRRPWRLVPEINHLGQKGRAAGPGGLRMLEAEVHFNPGEPRIVVEQPRGLEGSTLDDRNDCEPSRRPTRERRRARSGR